MTASASISLRLMRPWRDLLPSTVILFIHVFQVGDTPTGASHRRVLYFAVSTSRWTRRRAVSVTISFFQPFHTRYGAAHGLTTTSSVSDSLARASSFEPCRSRCLRGHCSFTSTTFTATCPAY